MARLTRNGTKKFIAEKGQLLKRKDELDGDLEDFNQELLVLPYMLNLPGIFEDASINQQHAILNEVFKHGLTCRDGMFRTPWIHPEFEHNLLKLKQLRLLEIEQPHDNSNGISYCGEGGIRTLDEHLDGILEITREILENEKDIILDVLST